MSHIYGSQIKFFLTLTLPANLYTCSIINDKLCSRFSEQGLPDLSDFPGADSSDDGLPGPSRSSSRAGKDKKKSKDSDGKNYYHILR